MTTPRQQSLPKIQPPSTKAGPLPVEIGGAPLGTKNLDTAPWAGGPQYTPDAGQWGNFGSTLNKQGSKAPTTTGAVGGGAAGGLGGGVPNQGRTAGPLDFDGDAFASIKELLDAYGLSGLADFVKEALIEGLSEAEIMRNIREHPTFAARFPAIKAREKAGMPPLSPAEYIAYERQAAQLMRAAGLPKGFYDGNDDFTTFLTGDVSLAELQQRIELGRDAAYNAPADVKEQLQRLYGISEGGLTAYFLDPTRAEPLLAQQFQASKIAASANRTGFGLVTALEAETLAKKGISESEASEGFGLLAASEGLFDSFANEGPDISREEQLGAAFDNSAAARRRIEQRRAGRRSVFEGGGNILDSQEGVIGLGDSSRR